MALRSFWSPLRASAGTDARYVSTAPAPRGLVLLLEEDARLNVASLGADARCGVDARSAARDGRRAPAEKVSTAPPHLRLASPSPPPPEPHARGRPPPLLPLH